MRSRGLSLELAQLPAMLNWQKSIRMRLQGNLPYTDGVLISMTPEDIWILKNIGGFESSESEEENNDEEEAAIISPGRPRTTRTSEKVIAIQEYLEIDCQMSVRELADACEIDKSTGFSGKTLETWICLGATWTFWFEQAKSVNCAEKTF